MHGVAWRLTLMSVACEAPPVAEEASRVRRAVKNFKANADEIFGNRKIIVCGSKRKGAIPTFSGGYHRLFPQKEMGVIYKNEIVSTLPPLTRSPSPIRGGFRADSIRPYGLG